MLFALPCIWTCRNAAASVLVVEAGLGAVGPSKVLVSWGSCAGNLPGGLELPCAEAVEHCAAANGL